MTSPSAIGLQASRRTAAARATATSEAPEAAAEAAADAAEEAAGGEAGGEAEGMQKGGAESGLGCENARPAASESCWAKVLGPTPANDYHYHEAKHCSHSDGLTQSTQHRRKHNFHILSNFAHSHGFPVLGFICWSLYLCGWIPLDVNTVEWEPNNL